MEEYDRAVDAARMSYNTRTTRQRYARDENYIDFRSRVWVRSVADQEVQGEGAMPPLTDAIPAEPGDEDDDGDELEVGGARIDYKCPLTATLLADPVTKYVHANSLSCGHAYSRAAVLEYINAARRDSVRPKCPAAACTECISERSLCDDVVLRRRVERYERQLLRREERRRDAARATAAVLD